MMLKANEVTGGESLTGRKLLNLEEKQKKKLNWLREETQKKYGNFWDKEKQKEIREKILEMRLKNQKYKYIKIDQQRKTK